MQDALLLLELTEDRLLQIAVAATCWLRYCP
jgi:hypothetical protein